MRYKNRKFTLVFTLILLGLILSGCATSSKMQMVPPERVTTVADEGKAMVVFMRPSDFGGAVQSSVFEIKNERPELIGIVSANTKVSYQLEPGSYLFMVIGESADFMSAELEANKTYYALVTPRMGFWKARFSLKPIHAAELDSDQFNEWFEECDLVENTPASGAWARENMSSILSKQTEYYADWMDKATSDRPKLLPEDGK
jgi:hypothetical protein